MPDDAGLGDHRRDPHRSACGVLSADSARDDVDAVDPVLKRDDDRVRSEERREESGRRLGVVELDGEEHDVDRTHRTRIAGGVHARHVEIAADAVNREAARAQSLEMCAAGDERHVGPRRREPSAEISTDAARAQYRDTHCDILTVFFFALAAGPHPRRELSQTPRRSRGAVWPQALLMIYDGGFDTTFFGRLASKTLHR